MRVAAGQSAHLDRDPARVCGVVQRPHLLGFGRRARRCRSRIVAPRLPRPSAHARLPVAFAQTEDMGHVPLPQRPCRRVLRSGVHVPVAGSDTRSRRASRTPATFFPDATDVTFAQPVLVGADRNLPAWISHWPLPGNARSADDSSIRPAAHWRRRWFALFSVCCGRRPQSARRCGWAIPLHRCARRGLHAQRSSTRPTRRSWTTAFREVLRTRRRH